ncbi:MAG TPA: MATE family efflux transporter [Geminicoccus sp.]|uniref:MATE family efflux transporter n=1 Tax=Geminicoccus sp. TaxID=2024832 RepID=UPI002E370812|nr:MATE family efflux transporter [Geminicoccus sp.]HEX2526736.1 MATE family efflux transporter [Geminicoccus sp.]
MCGLSAFALLNSTDTAIVAPLGTDAVAALGLASAVWLLTYGSVYGALSPISIAVARAHAGQDLRAIDRILRAGLLLGAAMGMVAAVVVILLYPAMPWLGQPDELLAMVFGYWITLALSQIPMGLLEMTRETYAAIDRPWTGVALGNVAVVLNVPLSIVLVHGGLGLPALGLLGAGIGTLAAMMVGVIVALAKLRRDGLLPGGTPLQDILAEARRLLLPCLGAGVQYLAEASAFSGGMLLIGLLGPVPLAASQIVLSVATLVYMLPLGIAVAAGLRLAGALGADETTRLRPIAVTTLLGTSLWMGITALVFVLGGSAFAGWFSDDPAVLVLAAQLFGLVALMQLADGLQSVAVGGLRGLNDVRVPTIATVVGYWVLSLPIGWGLAFPLDLGAAGIWIGFFIGLSVAAAVLVPRLLARTG